MCIALISNKHPSYPLILASNRDEFLARPTLPADFWSSPNQDILGGRDLLRAVQGTWLGVTKDGRIAVLTNFREDTIPAETPISRGEMVNAFLTAKKEDVADTDQFVRKLIAGEAARGSGGFSLMCGKIGEPLAVVSNRMQNEGEVKWIGKIGERETVGLSNAAFGDHSWPKVVSGEEQMDKLIEIWLQKEASIDDITQSLFSLLSTNTLPVPSKEESWDTTVKQLRNSIFIPKIGSEEVSADAFANTHHEAKTATQKATSGAYGTQKQTVVIVDKHGHLFFSEKTLFDEFGKDISGRLDSVRSFDFDIS